MNGVFLSTARIYKYIELILQNGYSSIVGDMTIQDV